VWENREQKNSKYLLIQIDNKNKGKCSLDQINKTDKDSGKLKSSILFTKGNQVFYTVLQIN